MSADMETIFYRAVALSKDEISDDEKHAEILKSSDSMFEKNPKVSELQLFFSNSMKDRVKKSKITPGNSGRKSSVVHRSLRDRFVSLIVTVRKISVLSRLSTLVIRSH